VADAEIGVFGGSGFYSFLDDVEAVSVDTPYGLPSSQAFIGELGGRRVAFLPRHGVNHELPPQAINYRANVWAMKIGDFVVCDQFVDRTTGRRDTFYDGPVTTHVSAADPYSPVLRELLVAGCRELGISVHDRGTVVVIQGPRFSTRAESRWFSQMGWEVINMTAYPEGYLARELELCYANVSLITDYDVGLEGMEGVPPVSHEEVVRVFGENNARLRELLFAVIPRIPKDPDPHCAQALVGARF
jgi:5'-methylthioadenosine phosphorylase